MAVIISDGFEPYDGKGGKLEGWPFAYASLRVTDECNYMSPDIQLEVRRTEGGKWLLKVNGADLIFDQRPCFTVPARHEEPKSHWAYFIRPKLLPDDVSGYEYGLPLAGEDGAWLEFDTLEAAEAEALARGYGRENVFHELLSVVWPTLETDDKTA